MSTHEQKQTELVSDIELVDAYPYVVWHVVETPLLVKLGVCPSKYFPKRYTPVATVWTFSLDEVLKLTCTADGWESPEVVLDPWTVPWRNTVVGDVLVARASNHVVTPTGFQEFDFDWN
jgi:hypothetical protein